jgi:putative oxidoreductase
MIFIPDMSSVIILVSRRDGAKNLREFLMSNQRKVDAAAMLLRTGLGLMFVSHALLKYFVFTLPGTAKFFESLGLPGPLGYLTFGVELIGGALLIAGVYTRIVALAVLPFLLGAAWAHSGNGWVFNAPNGGWEYPVFLVLVAVVTALLGDRAPAGALIRGTGRAKRAGNAQFS